MSAADASGESVFSRVFAAFCSELRETFPELADGIRRVEGRATPIFFWNSWKHDLMVLAKRDFAALQERRRGILIVPVVMTPSLWSEISEASQAAVWRYLRTLVLEAVMELRLDTASITEEYQGYLMSILIEERGTVPDEDEETVSESVMEEAMEHLTPLMDRLKGMMHGVIDTSGLDSMFDASGGLKGLFGVSGDIPLPEIPEHLRKGRIARLAEDMVKQFDPSDFGIDPTLLQSDNVAEVLRRLAEMYQRDPTKMMTGAKRVAEKIKRQIMGGSLDREGLIAEAKEFVELFRNHPMFKEAIAKFEGIVGAGGLAEMFSAASSDGGATSERLRAVQERLRKKLAAREAAKKTGGAGAGSGGPK